MDIGNGILNSGELDAEGFTASAQFQATFCKLARLGSTRTQLSRKVPAMVSLYPYKTEMVP